MNKTAEFDFKRKILYPSCIFFFVLVFLYFLIAMAAGLNVTEAETERTQYYDGEVDAGSFTSETKEPSALPVQTLLGLFLFGAAVVSLRLIFKTGISRIYARLIHYVGTVLAFLLFVVVLSGAATSTAVPLAVVAVFAVSVIYFLVFGAELLLKRLFADKKESISANRIAKYVNMTLAGFTVIVFAVSLFALISQLNVIVRVQEEKTFVTDKAFEDVFVTVVTPLAPTLQNYLRYLASAAVFALGYFVLFTGINKVYRALINFAVLTAGYMGIWIIGFDYFRLVRSNAIPAIVIYLAVYTVVLITVCAVLYVRKRKNERNEEYQRQFSVGRKTE